MAKQDEMSINVGKASKSRTVRTGGARNKAAAATYNSDKKAVAGAIFSKFLKNIQRGTYPGVSRLILQYSNA
jgi:hypothetical protein